MGGRRRLLVLLALILGVCHGAHHRHSARILPLSSSSPSSFSSAQIRGRGLSLRGGEGEDEDGGPLADEVQVSSSTDEEERKNAAELPPTAFPPDSSFETETDKSSGDDLAFDWSTGEEVSAEYNSEEIRMDEEQMKRNEELLTFRHNYTAMPRWPGFEDAPRDCYQDQAMWELRQRHKKPRSRGITWRPDEDGDPSVREYEIVILGGGPAAGHCVKELCFHKVAKEQCLVVSMEQAVPYERPALTKSYIKGKVQSPKLGGMHCVELEELMRRRIDVKLCSKAISIDWEKREVLLQSTRFGDAMEEVAAFKHLVLATGSSPIMLDVPGASLGNILYAKTVVDIDRIKKNMVPGKRAVVVGGGYIAMEVGAALRCAGVETTIVLRGDRFNPRLFNQNMSAFIEQVYTDHGVKIQKEGTVVELVGSGKNVTGVKLEGGAILDCDFVVVGIGSAANMDLLEGSGVETGACSATGKPGIVVDEHFRTNVEGVYAVGDACLFPSKKAGGKLIQDMHVCHARESGRKAARVVLGKPLTPYDPIPHQYSSVDEWSFAWGFWGITWGEPILIGNMTNNDGWYALWFDQGGKLCGAMHCAVDVEDVELEADYGTNYNSEVVKHLVQLAPPYPTYGNATEMLQESVSARLIAGTLLEPHEYIEMNNILLEADVDINTVDNQKTTICI